MSTRVSTSHNIFAAAQRFSPGAGIEEIREYGGGNVNDTFLVTTASTTHPDLHLYPHPQKYFILQRINRRVFRRPELVMQNMRTLTEHVSRRLTASPVAGRRWEMVRILTAEDLSDRWIDPEGSFWRALTFIVDAVSFDTIKNMDHASEVGYCLGLFHSLVSDLPPAMLGDTLEGFHVTPLYLRHYDEVVYPIVPPFSKGGQGGFSRDAGTRLDRGNAAHAGAEYCEKFIDSRREAAGVLEDARERGILRIRTIHGDPKVNNVMIDTRTGRAVSIIDLDTVKPGLVQYDIGDCLRSCCNPLGEETERPDEVRFEPDLCSAILKGYFSAAKEFLTENDCRYIYDSVRLIAFELGVRFFTDYLEGNVYFKVKHREHNLARALVQFRLAESIESQEQSIRAIIRDAG